MNAIRNVFTALANLASSINGLAAVLDVATGKLRQQLALDDGPAVIEHAPGESEEPTRNGRTRKAAAV